MRGVNAYVDEAMRTPAALPLEFKMLGITPGKWTPEVVISRHQALTSNVQNEARLRGRLARSAADKLRDLLWLQGGHPTAHARPAHRSQDVPGRCAEVYNAFRDSIDFQARGRRARVSRPGRPPSRPPRAPRWRSRADGSRVTDNDIGSNNWVVSGARTQSGMPIMANDPHRVIAAPSLRYWVHLVAPGWNVIGGGEPVLPGVSIGHNEYGAWGLTIFGTDSEDLYVYETNPANAERVSLPGALGGDAGRHRDDSGEGAGRREGGAEVHAARARAPRGHGQAPRLRAARRLDGQGGAPYLASLRMNQAKTWAEFVEACTYNRMPVREHGMGRQDRHDRLAGRGHRAATRLEWPAAGAGRRPLRMGWLPPCQRAAERSEPRRAASSPRRTTTSTRTTFPILPPATTCGPIRTARIASRKCLVRAGVSAWPR